ncbi:MULTISPECIES: hypothetical protein [unclassified Streptomyces]|uniref:hypothetical protein n=1 Tax=unclassified Streptomyces TaxID=2593676 RepID=UPI003815A734
MYDQTCLRTEGIAELLRQHPNVKAEADEGYRGLANEFPDQISAPSKKSINTVRPTDHTCPEQPDQHSFGRPFPSEEDSPTNVHAAQAGEPARRASRLGA